jgi:Xaa-Pro aminopeptidase
MFKNCISILLFLVIHSVCSQSSPHKFLSSDFHKNRRSEVRAMLPKNSVAVFFANPTRNRSNDVDYHYHQDPNFYYLTGYKEPHAMLLLFSNDVSGVGEMIFVQPRNPLAEQWNGKRLGVEGVKQHLQIAEVYKNSEFKTSTVDFKNFDKVLFFDFKNDVRDSSNSADLYDLIQQFKEKTAFPDDFDASKQQVYELIKSTDVENVANVAQTLGRTIKYNPTLKDDTLIRAFQETTSEATRIEIKQKIAIKASSTNLDAVFLPEIMGRLREVKTEEELVLLKKAIRISSIAQQEVMKAMHPELSETEIQGIHEFVYKKYGAAFEGYPSIVGGGNNGCILHYIQNDKPRVGDDLVLMDLGAEYGGYTADVTRTIPANGVFSPEQRIIYQLVFDAQEAGIRAATVGAPFGSPGKVARDVIAKGLMDLEIISQLSDVSIYFPHGASHYLGLDVHDPGTYATFKPNTVITVEPGIYIPENSNCDPKWWGIAVRIEDDILITEDGPVNLSVIAPRTIEDIENLMKQSSPLDQFELPKL